MPSYTVINHLSMEPQESGKTQADLLILRNEDGDHLPVFTSMALFREFVDDYFDGDDSIEPSPFPMDPFYLAEAMESFAEKDELGFLIFNPTALCPGVWSTGRDLIPVVNYGRFMSEIRPGIQQAVQESMNRFGIATLEPAANKEAGSSSGIGSRGWPRGAAPGRTDGGRAAMPRNSAPPYALTKCANPDAIIRRSSDISDGKEQLDLSVAYVAVEPEERTIEMSRGSGRLQRQILKLLEQSPERKMNRAELDRVLINGEGFDPSNIRRAILGLARKHRVSFADRRHKTDSVVALPSEVRRINEDDLFDLFDEIANRGGKD